MEDDLRAPQLGANYNRDIRQSEMKQCQHILL